MPTKDVHIHPMADRALVPIAVALMLVVGLVLVIACANVASMLLARASGRQKEIGIRLAIGASRRRIVQQLLSETLVLAVLGGVAGVALAWMLMRLMMSHPAADSDSRCRSRCASTSRVVLFTAGVALLAALVAGLAPALKSTRPNLVSELKGDMTMARTGGRRWTLRDALVVTQIAVTTVLLVAAGLLTRSLMAAQQIGIGFRTAGIAIVSTDMKMIGYDDARAKEFFDRVLERLRSLPDVESAALAERLPFSINYNRNNVFLPDRHGPNDKGLVLDVTRVSPEYFATLGVPILQGRNFNAADTPKSPRVAIVNETMAHKFWPNENAVGKHFRLRGLDGPEVEIVGITADHKVSSLGEASTPYIHYAVSQQLDSNETILVRGARRCRGDAEHGAPRNRGDRTQYRLSRQPDDGRAGGGDAAAGEAGRGGRQRRGCGGDGAGRDRALRRDRLRGGAAVPGNWHSHGARRAAVGGRGAGAAPGAGPGGGRDSASVRSRARRGDRGEPARSTASASSIRSRGCDHRRRSLRSRRWRTCAGEAGLGGQSL